MSSSYTLPRAPVLIVGDPRLRDPSTALWDAQSSYSRAGPVPAVADTASALLTVEAGGTVEEPGQDVEVQVIRGGQPGRTTKAATFAHRIAGGTWRGQDLPSALAGVQRIEDTTGASATFTTPSIVALPSGVALLAYSVAGTGDDGIAVRRLAPGDTDWGDRVLVHDDAADVASQYPILTVAGAAVLLIAWVASADASSWHLRTWVSHDEGQTWATLGAYATAETDVATSGALRPRRIAAAYHAGQLLVLAHLYRPAGTFKDTIRQYASGDLGASFTTVYTQTGTTYDASGGHPAAVTVDGAILAIWARSNNAGTTGSWVRARLGSAFQSIAAADTYGGEAWDGQTVDVTASAIIDADLAACVDDAGLLWLHWRYADPASGSAQRCGVVVSGDGGRTTEPVGVDPTDPTDPAQSTTWWASAPPGTSSDAYPTRLATCYHRGRVLLAATHTAATSALDLSIDVWTLGGWSSTTLPPTRRGSLLGDRASWWHTWAPIERPDDLASTYTTTTSGTSAAALSGGALQITTSAAGGSRYYTEPAFLSGDPTHLIAEAAVTATAGGSLLSAAIALRLRVSDGATYGAEIELRFTSTAIRVYDLVAAAALATVSGLSAAPRAVRIGLSADGLRVYHRDHASLDEARDWTLTASATPADDGGAGGASAITWGTVASAADVDARWHHVAWSPGKAGGDHAAGVGPSRWDAWDASAAPVGLQGATLSTSPYYVADGLTLRGRTGPAAVGDTATLSTAYQWPIERIFAARSRSPRAPWRSADEQEQQIALRLTATPATLAAGASLSPLLGLVIRGANWRTGKLQRWTGSAWSDVVSIDLAGPLGAVAYSRTGDTVRPSSSATSAGYLLEGELVGATWAAGSTRRRILAQAEGAWEGSASWDGPRAVLALSGAAPTDPSSGTGAVWRTDAAILFAAPATAGGWRLIIDAQTTADGYLQIGSLLLGPAWPAAALPDWATQDELSGGRRRRVRDDGSAVVYGAAPPAREVSLAWTDGADESGALDGDAPAWLLWGSDPVSARAAWLRRLRSLTRDHDGQPVALVSAVTDTTPQTVTARADLVVGTLTSSHRLEGVVGDYGRSQVQRLAALTVSEDV